MMKKQPSLFNAVMPLLFLSTVMVVLPNQAQADYVRAIEAWKHRDWKSGINECLADAIRGEPNCQNFVGVMYGYGLGVSQDSATAVMWYRLAAGEGNPKAQYNLGRAYDNAWGIERNSAKAAYWFQLSADQGFGLAKQWVNKEPGSNHHETTYTDGSRYKGGWYQAQPYGAGVLTFSNGSRYEGNFVNGKFEGHGKFTFADGRYCDGEWASHRFIVGEGRGYCYADGDEIRWGG